MNCPHCGAEAVENAKFCNQCGQPLEVAAAQAATPGANLAGETPAYEPYNVGDGAAQTAQASAQASYTVGGTDGWQAAPQPESPYQGQYQTSWQQPAAPAYATGNGAIYPMTDTDTTLRLINFILCVISAVSCAMLVVPLAWMIPMTVISWGIYKGKKRNTIAFGVCTLIFVNVIGGILLLCSHTDE